MFQFQNAAYPAPTGASPAVWQSPPAPPPPRGVVASLPTVRLGEASPPASARLLTSTPPPSSARSFNVRSVPSNLHYVQSAQHAKSAQWQHTASEPAPGIIRMPPRISGPVTVVRAAAERVVVRSQPAASRPDDAVNEDIGVNGDKMVAPIAQTPSAQEGSPSSKAAQSPSSSPQASTRVVASGSPTSSPKVAARVVSTGSPASSPKLGTPVVLAPPSPRQGKGVEVEMRLSQVAAALLPPASQAGGRDAGPFEPFAPAPEEVPLWRSCQTTPPVLLDATNANQEIAWTPSFTTLAHLRPQGAIEPAPQSPEATTEDTSSPQEDKPSRASMAPTVHDAVCTDDEESEAQGSPDSAEEIPPWAAMPLAAEPRQASKEGALEPVEPAEAQPQVPPELLSELEELRQSLAVERAQRLEAEASQARTSQRLSSAEGRAAQLSSDLQRCKVERDELRRQLHEKSEIHVELTRKLRKAQEANKSLDTELNKAEALRLAAHNHAAAARDAKCQLEVLFDSLRDQLRDVEEVEETLLAAKLCKLKDQLAAFSMEPRKDPEAEEELPTAGGLLREWASVYNNAEDTRAEPPGPVLLQQRTSGWSKSSRHREDRQILSSPPSARGPGEQIAQLSLRDLSEIKALKKPPPPIRMLMEVCCLLFHIQPVKHLDEQCVHHRLRTDYWEPARRYLLSDPFLLSKLRSHGKDVAPAQRAKIKKYFKDPDFSAERMLKCSRAAFELYSCVLRLMDVDESHASHITSQSDVRSVACTTTTASSNETITTVR